MYVCMSIYLFFTHGISFPERNASALIRRRLCPIEILLPLNAYCIRCELINVYDVRYMENEISIYEQSKLFIRMLYFHLFGLLRVCCIFFYCFRSFEPVFVLNRWFLVFFCYFVFCKFYFALSGGNCLSSGGWYARLS